MKTKCILFLSCVDVKKVSDDWTIIVVLTCDINILYIIVLKETKMDQQITVVLNSLQYGLEQCNDHFTIFKQNQWTSYHG